MPEPEGVCCMRAGDIGGALMDVGDYIFVTRAGGLRFLPKTANGKDGRELADRSDRFVGVVHELRDKPEDIIVALEPPVANMEPVRLTIRTLRRMYG